MTSLQNDFIPEFIEEVIRESGITINDKTQSDRLKKAVERRITARIFLEMLTVLSPEQIVRVTTDMTSEQQNTEQLLSQLSKEVPAFSVHMAAALTGMHEELLKDIKTLTSAGPTE